MQAGMLFFSYFCNMNMEEVIRQTVEVLQQGKTLLYPTDTIWGIGYIPSRSAATQKACLC